MWSLVLLTAATSLVQAAQLSALDVLSNPHLRRTQQPSGPQSAEIIYPAHYLSVPVDHFHNESRYEPHSDEHFPLRYWFDAQYYRHGGPVFVIAAGETSGEDRFPFLSQGIVTQLAEKYHGIGVILEHRYYGESYPFDELTTENIRFLSTEQAMADYAYFASNVVFSGLEHLDLSPSTTPWIAYGGSYAGAFVAFLRKLYPDIYWGSVSSSGVTAAIIDYWEYYEPIRKFGPPDCIQNTQTFIDIVDNVLIKHSGNKTMKAHLLSSMGVPCDMKNENLAGMLSYGLDSWQSRSWDPAIGSPLFRQYCDNITSSDLLYPETAAVRGAWKSFISAAGYNSADAELVMGLLNHVGFLNTTVFSPRRDDLCPKNGTSKAIPADAAQPKPLNKTSDVSWNYQVCTEWGFFQTGASVPSNIKPLISRSLTLENMSSFCDTIYGINTPPDIDRINKYGGFGFSYPRVGIIDGLADPWRDATPHADGAPERKSTIEKPFLLIEMTPEEVWDGAYGAVHHWDQNGLSRKQLLSGETPPQAIAQVQSEVADFIGKWLNQWLEGYIPHL
ncbi:serine carboxypeptidase S28-domain-containing protein [Aspergillus ambiguus]|uniref:putative extracelular serine carboxypeptidase n=1 Tax=Aspergillus ambiguus TaxID=176160 RepID=UPI003CCDAC7C